MPILTNTKSSASAQTLIESGSNFGSDHSGSLHFSKPQTLDRIHDVRFRHVFAYEGVPEGPQQHEADFALAELLVMFHVIENDIHGHAIWQIGGKVETLQEIQDLRAASRRE